MVGEPHALPYITSGGGQIDQGDDTIFASESGITSMSTSTSTRGNLKQSFASLHPMQPSLRRPLLVPSLPFLALAIAITGDYCYFYILQVVPLFHPSAENTLLWSGLLKCQKKGRSQSIQPTE